MSDYISKGKLMSHIESQYRSFGEDYDALQILGDIEDFPTEERPHGEWEKKPEICYDYFYCSECGYAYKHAFNFCPNCGAKMKGGDEK